MQNCLELHAADFEDYTALINIICGKNTEPLNITGGQRLIRESKRLYALVVC
jgi:hypothetical protein